MITKDGNQEITVDMNRATRRRLFKARGGFRTKGLWKNLFNENERKLLEVKTDRKSKTSIKRIIRKTA